MRKIVYYVATSLDGFIGKRDGDISQFVPGGNGIDKYLEDLKGFDTVIMGRSTYEFGYRFGLEPGQSPYPHMQNYVLSRTLSVPRADPSLHIVTPSLGLIRNLKEAEGTPIYLCGGGVLAGWLLDNDLIDVVKIKLNPFIMGEGIRMFGDSQRQVKVIRKSTEQFDHGLQIMTFDVAHE